MSRIFFEVLTDAEKKELDHLRHFSKSGMLVGGTALALQINHRRSYDFDVFFNEPLSSFFPGKAKRVFGKIEIIKDREGEELTFMTKSGIKITFFYYPFKPLFKKIPTDYIKLVSWKDIALDKAYTIGRRAAYRDYVDLFFILKKKCLALSWVIKNAKKKFGDLFSEKLFLGQLIYLKDVRPVRIEFVSEVVYREELERFLEKETSKYWKTKFTAPR